VAGNSTAVANSLGSILNPEGVLLQITDGFLYTVNDADAAATLDIGIGATGVLMRYFTKTDIVSVKMMAMGLVSFNPSIPQGIGPLFYTHLFLICTLFAYFPFSKLVHMGGVFMSPTRVLANTSRVKRHVNPWNYPVHVHTYDEYENDFRAKMKEAGLPVEKE
jgi:hypothetical protein